MREVVPGPWRGRQLPNISDVSLPLTQTHTHTHGQTDTLSHAPNHQPTRPGTHAYVHTDTLPGRHPTRQTHSLTDTHTPCYWTSTGSYTGRGVYYQIEDRWAVVIIIILAWKLRLIFSNNDYVLYNWIWSRLLKWGCRWTVKNLIMKRCWET